MSRRDFSKAVKRAAAARADGHCEACTARLAYGQYHYDHVLPDWLGGEPELENCQVLCITCHRLKTADMDVPRIAKTKRTSDQAISIRKPRQIRGWRKFNGEAVRAASRRD
ncbi:HNH endonuclease [Flaviflagellibacter deserti]|uniref:HNH endonuclease n=1 Tax=Flaviflagellibacter deserti TaxID=2267266 RepID=A0ABV9YWR1_9HYPH